MTALAATSPAGWRVAGATAMPGIPTLTTARLTLRAPRIEDFEAFAAYRASDRTTFVGGRQGQAAAFSTFSALFGHWALRGFGRWIVADRETDAAIGVVGPFFPVDWPEPEIAWTVFAAAEGKGLAFEAAKASRDWAYATLGRRTAISCIDPENRRSIALAERLGARRDGSFTHPEYGEMAIWRHPGPETAA